MIQKTIKTWTFSDKDIKSSKYWMPYTLCNTGKIAWEQFTRYLGRHCVSCLDFFVSGERNYMSISGLVIQLCEGVSVWSTD